MATTASATAIRSGSLRTRLSPLAAAPISATASFATRVEGEGLLEGLAVVQAALHPGLALEVGEVGADAAGVGAGRVEAQGAAQELDGLGVPAAGAQELLGVGEQARHHVLAAGVAGREGEGPVERRDHLHGLALAGGAQPLVQQRLGLHALHLVDEDAKDLREHVRPPGQQQPQIVRNRQDPRIAASDLPILVTGENGTGKELLARTIHRKSRRAQGPFVAVNCAALPETLLESALFGHVRGAFTGAVRDRKGLFLEADRGTLFLDEIGDMTASLQVKVLRAIESGEILPVGADVPTHVDVRLLSATNKDLAALQAKGEFREDLYWRIKGTEVRLPPLRERAGDIPVLAKHFLNQSAHLCPDGRARLLSEAAESALVRHAWPGNLRELRHEMQRATVLVGDRREIQPEDLSFTEADRAPRPPAGTWTLPEKVEALERREIEEALRTFSGNRTHAAEALGLSRQGLLKKMERFGLT